jgi:hypothetical protein
MSLLRSIAGGLRSLFRREQVGQELDQELNCFLEMAAEEKTKQGMSSKEALRAVRVWSMEIWTLRRKSCALPAGNILSRRGGRICVLVHASCAKARASPPWL